MKLFKSIGAIFAGFVSVALLSIITDAILEGTHVFPPVTQPGAYVWWMLLIALIYRSLYAVVGGYITALLSKQNAMRNVVILGIIGTIAATLGLLANLDKGSVWYPILLAVLSFPSVWLGGKLRMKHTSSRA